jgi:uncharacterized membrane protein YtjA (UPF0391 family)
MAADSIAILGRFIFTSGEAIPSSFAGSVFRPLHHQNSGEVGMNPTIAWLIFGFCVGGPPEVQEPGEGCRRSACVKGTVRGPFMLEWILILLVIAAVAGLLGLNAISGVALTGAKVLIGIVLVLFLLMLLGVYGFG